MQHTKLVQLAGESRHIRLLDQRQQFGILFQRLIRPSGGFQDIDFQLQRFGRIIDSKHFVDLPERLRIIFDKEIIAGHRQIIYGRNIRPHAFIHIRRQKAYGFTRFRKILFRHIQIKIIGIQQALFGLNRIIFPNIRLIAFNFPQRFFETNKSRLHMIQLVKMQIGDQQIGDNLKFIIRLAFCFQQVQRFLESSHRIAVPSDQQINQTQIFITGYQARHIILFLGQHLKHHSLVHRQFIFSVNQIIPAVIIQKIEFCQRGFPACFCHGIDHIAPISQAIQPVDITIITSQ